MSGNTLLPNGCKGKVIFGSDKNYLNPNAWNFHAEGMLMKAGDGFLMPDSEKINRISW